MLSLDCQRCGVAGLWRRVCEFICSHLDVRGLAEPRAEAPLLLLAAGSGTKARVQRKASNGALRSCSRVYIAAPRWLQWLLEVKQPGNALHGVEERHCLRLPALCWHHRRRASAGAGPRGRTSAQGDGCDGKSSRSASWATRQPRLLLCDSPYLLHQSIPTLYFSEPHGWRPPM